ncbi:chorismate mutase [Pseudomonas putida]|uniref:chorismate mutase n=1 Tax=Pseudomonas putida TaxID=303 RepID=A0A6I6XTP4_PSEPU|nr:chorismate mutase [Pseudomonas putida]QHG67445.1 chorismate mutase [Pseudomonas putida]
MRPLPFVLCFVLPLFGCSSPSQPELKPLLAAIGQRLDLAYAVAVHKWDNGVPVEAPLREQEVLQQVQAAAHDYDLTPERAAAFFADQIEANKIVQYGLIDRWTALGKRPPQQARNLADELRPRLDMLQATLLFELGNLDRKPLDDCSRQLTDALAGHASDPLRHMALVRATAHLCVKR